MAGAAKIHVFAAAAIITLALGIGGNDGDLQRHECCPAALITCAKSAATSLLWGYPTGQPSGAHSTGASDSAFSLPTFEALRQDGHGISAVMAFVPLGVGKVAVRAANGTPEQAAGAMVSGNFFSGLGVAAARGALWESQTRHRMRQWRSSAMRTGRAGFREIPLFWERRCTSKVFRSRLSELQERAFRVWNRANFRLLDPAAAALRTESVGQLPGQDTVRVTQLVVPTTDRAACAGQDRTAGDRWGNT